MTFLFILFFQTKEFKPTMANNMHNSIQFTNNRAWTQTECSVRFKGYSTGMKTERGFKPQRILGKSYLLCYINAHIWLNLIQWRWQPNRLKRWWHFTEQCECILRVIMLICGIGLGTEWISFCYTSTNSLTSKRPYPWRASWVTIPCWDGKQLGRSQTRGWQNVWKHWRQLRSITCSRMLSRPPMLCSVTASPITFCTGKRFATVFNALIFVMIRLLQLIIDHSLHNF